MQCAICQHEVVEPTFTRCKHVFCRSCILAEIDRQIADNFRNERDTVCPVCRGKVQKKNGRLIQVRLDAQPAQPPPAAAGFEPSARFAGARQGMVFRCGVRGVGYYPTTQQPARLPPTQLSQDFIHAFTSEMLGRLALPAEAQQYDPVQGAMYPHVPPAAMWAYSQSFDKASSKILEVCKQLRQIRANDAKAKCLVFSRENNVHQ